MKNLAISTAIDVDAVYLNYPDAVREQMLELRQLVLETASESHEIESIEEALKWGEPSFLCQHGSTLRVDWKAKQPNQYAMYFKCTSRLVDTFKLVFSDEFDFEGNRAIVFQLDQKIPVKPLKQCILAALNYHKVKQLDRLGMTIEASQ